MKKHEKETLVTLMGAIGFIVLLVGIFTPVDFTYALLAALIIWILTGVVKKYFKIKK
jgi:uncharacterized membrane protein